MITFNSGSPGYKLKNKREISSWIKSVIADNGRISGDIAFVFMSDEELSEMNYKYLKHNTLTDIITFNYNEKDIINGDICISIDRISENALKFGVDTASELKRVMIHGILHLLGFNDKTENEKSVMRSQEDFYLTKLNF